jgi:hypothetical protein
VNHLNIHLKKRYFPATTFDMETPLLICHPFLRQGRSEPPFFGGGGSIFERAPSPPFEAYGFIPCKPEKLLHE